MGRHPRRFLCVNPFLVCETSSALCSASLENLSSVSSLHSLTESVLHLSLSLLRLVCSFHIYTSFIIYNGRGRPALSIFSSHIIIQIFIANVNTFFVFLLEFSKLSGGHGGPPLNLYVIPQRERLQRRALPLLPRQARCPREVSHLLQEPLPQAKDQPLPPRVQGALLFSLPLPW